MQQYEEIVRKTTRFLDNVIDVNHYPVPEINVASKESRNLGLWSLIPDTIFLSLKELIEDGIELKGKCPSVARISAAKTLDDLKKLLPMIFNLISKESSQEIVVDDLPAVLGKFSKNTDDIEKMLVDVFTMSSTSTSLDKSPTILSFRIPLSADKKLINAIFSAYNTFVKSTPSPNIGIVWYRNSSCTICMG